MSNLKLFVVIVFTAVLTALLVSRGAVPVANANSPRTSSCVVAVPEGEGKDRLARANDGIRVWMDAQLAQGRSEFIIVGITPTFPSLCAW